MRVFVLRAPHRPGMRLPRYVSRVEDGRAELCFHTIEAKRFSDARHAHAWASAHGEQLADFIVERAH